MFGHFIKQTVFSHNEYGGHLSLSQASFFVALVEDVVVVGISVVVVVVVVTGSCVVVVVVVVVGTSVFGGGGAVVAFCVSLADGGARVVVVVVVVTGAGAAVVAFKDTVVFSWHRQPTTIKENKIVNFVNIFLILIITLVLIKYENEVLSLIS